MSQMSENDVVHIEETFSKIFLQLFPLSGIQNATEGLIVLLHSCLLEVRFVAEDVKSDAHSCMPDNWRSNGIFKIQYSHPIAPGIHCWVTWIPLYGNLVVQGTVEKNDSENNVHMTLSSNKYITSDGDLSDPRHIFCEPEDLLRLFKDEFCYPLLVLLEESADRKPSFGFSGLFNELKLSIMKLLPVEGVVSLSSVNKEFHHLSNYPYLWKFLYARDYGPKDSTLDSGIDRDWKELYKAEYLKRKNRQRFRPLPMYHPIAYPHIYPSTPNFDVDYRIDMDPALQQVFPHLRARFRPNNWLFPGGAYPYIGRFW